MLLGLIDPRHKQGKLLQDALVISLIQSFRLAKDGSILAVGPQHIQRGPEER